MWLAEKNRGAPAGSGAELGTVTLAGCPAGVYMAGERRNLPVLGPGGYAWAPEAGAQVLVIKTGEAGEAPCVAAARSECTVPPGTVRIFNGRGNASITLDADGGIALVGKVTINGKPWDGGSSGTESGPGGGGSESGSGGEAKSGGEGDGGWS